MNRRTLDVSQLFLAQRPDVIPLGLLGLLTALALAMAGAPLMQKDLASVVTCQHRMSPSTWMQCLHSHEGMSCR